MALNIAQTSQSLKLESQNSSALKQVWANLNTDSCPQFYNFHLHTTSSDGKLQVENLVQQACEIGLRGMAITDHHSVEGYQKAQVLLQDLTIQQSHTHLPHLWTGVEVTSQLLDVEVHILGYAFDPNHKAMAPYLQGHGHAPISETAAAANVINAIHQADGLAVLAHPARYKRSAKILIPAAASLGIDGVEAYYAYRNTNPWRPTPDKTEQVKHLGERYNLYSTCGTDTHGLNLLIRL